MAKAKSRQKPKPSGLHQSATSLVVVAVGASAGGLEALQAMVSHIPTDVGMAFVVAQHVSALHKSMMIELLGRVSSIPVLPAEDGRIMQPNTVYVCPPAVHVTIGAGDCLFLTPVDDAGHLPKPSIDLLFRSLAQWKQERAICVVLSGTGSDGTAGVRAVKEADGFSIAQDPASAKYDGMPSSAINTGKVDLVMHPEDIGVELASIALLPDRPIDEFDEYPNREIYDRILRMLKRVHGVDFSLYKDGTLSRRIMRRMIAKQAVTLETYETKLRQEESELHELFHDMLIGVTSFFRDRAAWDAVKRQLTTYIESKETALIRCWVAGCSTGEEAYTLAILIAEILGEKISSYRVQIFATDISSRAIEIARRGLYPSSLLTDLPDGLLTKYFSQHADSHMEVQKSIKQMLVFSEHDIAQDPPFLRQDFISCRNVLIYFKPELQEAVLPVFAYSLLPNALLLLGQAESLGSQTGQFEVIDPKEKIYRPLFSTGRPAPRSAASRELIGRERRSATTKHAAPSKQRRLSENLASLVAFELERVLTPMAILINSNDDIIFSHGSANPLLQRKPGLPSDNVFDNIHPEMLVDLRTALHIVSGGEQMTTTDFRHLSVHGEGMWARLIVTEVEHPEYKDLKLIYCQAEESIDVPFGVLTGDGESTDIVVRDQEKVISKLREQLSVVVEQLETSNAEMQSLNEELQSANEELQSSNEELETTNEELQSTNEELQTAYAELSVAFDEKQAEERKNRDLALALQRANDLLTEAEIVGMSGSWRWHPANGQTSFSSGTLRLLGLDDADFQPSFEKYLDFTFADDRELLNTYISDVMKGENRAPLSYRVVPVNGHPIYVMLSTAVRFTSFGQVESILGTLKDIDRKTTIESELLATARVISEKDVSTPDGQDAIKAAERLRDTLNAALAGPGTDRSTARSDTVGFMLSSGSPGVYVYDITTGTNSFVNASYTRILGYEQAELDRMDASTFGALFHPDDAERIAAHVEQMRGLAPGETLEISYRFKHKDGRWLCVYSMDTVLSVGSDGRATQIIGTFFDAEAEE